MFEEHHHALDILHNNLALQETPEGRWRAAIVSFQTALDYHRTVGHEEGLAVTYSQLGKAFLDRRRSVEAKRCLNHAAKPFITLGSEAGEAAVLRLLTEVSQGSGNRIAAIRCMERVVLIDRRYGLPSHEPDSRLLEELRRGPSPHDS